MSSRTRTLQLQLRLDRQQGWKLALFAAALFVGVWPWTPLAPYSLLGDAILAAQYSIVAVSLVLLIGWVGQISLAQAALVGVGAYSTGLVVNHLHIPFPANLPLAAAASGAVAAALGAAALRVRGLYLAVATLIFGYMCDAFLFHQEWFSGFGGNTVITQPVIGRSGAFPSFDLSDRRILYYVVWACALAAIYAAANLRSGKTGRAFFAVRGSEVAAASLGINVTRYKLLAFVLSGVLAGIAGNLIMVGNQSVTSSQFNLTTSLFFLSIAVVGGLTSLGGALAASFVFAALNEVFFRITALNGFLDLVSAGLLVAVLLTYPAGLGGIPDAVAARAQSLAAAKQRLENALQLRRTLRGMKPGAAADQRASRAAPAAERAVPARGGLVGGLLSGARRRLVRPARKNIPRAVPLELPSLRATALPKLDAAEGAEADEAEAVTVPTGASIISIKDLHRAEATSDPATSRDDRAAIVDVSDVTVRFGGVVANESVSMSVREGEITGLIGPNGAGKTTLFNAILGLNQPTSGSVHMFGRDVTTWQVHDRAQLGVARTFQAIQLFGQLTVFENLMVATHLHNPTGVLSHIVASARSIRADLAARERVNTALTLLDLSHLAARQVRDLPFGTLRMVEVARAVVTGARLVMLDEPASGLDNRETERLSDVLRYLRGTLGMTLLVIEHDVPFVTGVTDYIYVLDRGRRLSAGTPAEIQNDPAVMAAYLGGRRAAREAASEQASGAV